MRQLLSRAWYLIRRRRFDADLREELEFHRASIQRELEHNGTDQTAAHFAARRALGSVALAQDQARDVWTPRWLQGLGQDIRLAFRSLRATPIVTAVATLSLALGIGANTAIFSLVDALVLRALPVKEPGRLAVLDNGSWSNPIWEQVRALTAFDGSFAWGARSLNVTDGDETASINAIWASGSMFETLGVPAFMGRTLTRADDRRGGATTQVAVISYTFWQRHLAAAPDVVGRTLTIERVPFTIVGVTGPDFLGPDVGRAYDVAIPIAAEPIVQGTDESWLDERSTWWLQIMVRLKTDQTIEQGSAALRVVQHQIVQAAFGDPPLNNNLKEPFTLLPGSTGISNVRNRYERPLTIMLGVVALVLLIACANVANLLLARAAAHRKEWSVRLALGASRYRLVRLVLAESVVLAGMGAGAGMLFARWGAYYLLHEISPNANPVFLDLTIDWRVLAFTLIAAIATTLLSGTASAYRAADTARWSRSRTHHVVCRAAACRFSTRFLSVRWRSRSSS
jgi:putative ABC transport system permease protein